MDTPKPQVDESPFDKVLMVARIAQLEALNDWHEKAEAVKDSQIASMATMLQDISSRMTKAVLTPTDKIAEILNNVVIPWLSEESKLLLDQLIKDQMFLHGLGAGFKSLIGGGFSDADGDSSKK